MNTTTDPNSPATLADAPPVKAAHTPGPWICFQNESQKEHGGEQWSIGLSAEPLTGGARGDEYMLITGICSESDARLIASAPDLLAALESVTAELESVWRSDGMRNPNSYAVSARAAIAKAKGAQ